MWEASISACGGIGPSDTNAFASKRTDSAGLAGFRNLPVTVWWDTIPLDPAVGFTSYMNTIIASP